MGRLAATRLNEPRSQPHAMEDVMPRKNASLSGYRAEWVRTNWMAAHGLSYGHSVVLLPIEDDEYEYVKAQVRIEGGEGEPAEATYPAKYKIMQKKIDRDCYGDEYDPNGDGTHDYIRVQGMSIALDTFVWRGK